MRFWIINGALIIGMRMDPSPNEGGWLFTSIIFIALLGLVLDLYEIFLRRGR